MTTHQQKSMGTAQKKDHLKLVLAGGQSAGPIIPLFAVVEQLQALGRKTEVLVIDTESSVAKRLSNKDGFQFQALGAAKLRRYWSLSNLFSPFILFANVVRSYAILKKFNPDLVMGAGGHIQVGVAWAAWLLGIPVLIHQQDIRPSLANTIVAPIATRITTAFMQSVHNFSTGLGLFRSKRGDAKKVVWTGNPFREELREADKKEALNFFKLSDTNLPVLLVMGGGTGAEGINALLYGALPQLTKTMQIIHSTGSGKNKYPAQKNYHPYEFIERIDLAYAAATLIISRAGISAITEIANLGKMSIIMPMPGTHQEENAALLYKTQAAIVMDEQITTAELLISTIRKLLLDGPSQKLLHQNALALMPKHAAKKIADIIIEIHDRNI